MTRVLFTTIPITGHVRPALPVAQRLIDTGHEVTWYAGRKFEPLVQKTGARFVPVTAKLDFDDEDVDVLAAANDGKTGIGGLKSVIRDLFINPIPAYLEDLAPLFEEFDPDVVVADHCFTAGAMLAGRRGAGSVIYTVGPLSLSSVDVAPFGMALPPSSSAIGRLRNRSLHWVLRNVLLRDCQKLAERSMLDSGYDLPDGFFMDWPAQLVDRYIHAGVPEFEYPRGDLPASVEFVGAMLPTGVDDWEPPAWWDEVLRRDRPVALVTQGTAGREPGELLLPTIEGLASRDLTVVATTSGLDPDEVLPPARRPANLRLEPFVPYTELLPHTDVMVTNGGFGGVQMALSYGVPLVVAGKSEDKMEGNARVAWSGAGIYLKKQRPNPAAVDRAVRKVLDDPSYRRRARELRAAYARFDGPSRAAEVILSVAREVRRTPSRESA